jgi:hypothetical protein
MKTQSLSIAILALAIFVFAGVLLFKPINSALGGAFTGTSAFLQIATTTAIGPQDGEDTIFAARTDGSCKARVITTRGDSAIMLSFGDKTNGDFSSTTLSGDIGHLQAASTTVVYDSELYGCGRWTAYAWASSTISVSEF